MARHSGADQVAVELKVHGGELHVRVVDNGKGIALEDEEDTKSLGILGMRERAMACGGDVMIRGDEDRGTEVILRIPLAEWDETEKGENR